MTRRMLVALCRVATLPRWHMEPERARRIVIGALPDNTRGALLRDGYIVDVPPTRNRMHTFDLTERGRGAVAAARALRADPYTRRPGRDPRQLEIDAT